MQGRGENFTSSGCDVFVSYCRDDRARAFEVVRGLERAGLRVWWDARLAAGQAFDAEIMNALRSAKRVLVCWSPGSIESEWVRAEALEGFQRGALVTCSLAPCSPMPPFNILHTADLSLWRGEQADPCWLALLAAIRDGHRVNLRPIARPPYHRRRSAARAGAFALLLLAFIVAGRLVAPSAPPPQSPLANQEMPLVLPNADAPSATQNSDQGAFEHDMAATEENQTPLEELSGETAEADVEAPTSDEDQAPVDITAANLAFADAADLRLRSAEAVEQVWSALGPEEIWRFEIETPPSDRRDDRIGSASVRAIMRQLHARGVSREQIQVVERGDLTDELRLVAHRVE